MIHWKRIDTATKIEAIRAVWFPGCSTTQIASHFEGATRNAIIGVYNRYGKQQLADKPLRSHAAANSDVKHKNRRAAVTFLFAKPLPPKPLPEPMEIPSEQKLCGRPLMMLQAKQCRWPVNNANGDELHLFCALPSDGAYCCHHKRRAYQPQKAA